MKHITGKAREIHSKHEKAISIAFFFLGILFDILTLGRIDSASSLLQQAAFLLAIGALLDLEAIELRGALALRPGGKLERFWNERGQYREWAIHFLFGSLLSGYAIFYFQSASLLGSGIYFVILCALLVANELPSFKRLGPMVRFGLYGLCLSSYFAYLVPVLTGTIGNLEFVAAIALSSVLVVGNARWLARRWLSGRVPPRELFRETLVPPLMAQAAFLGLYLAGAVPPVPLSVQYMGIYHDVRKEAGGYALAHERPAWKIWENGDQTFKARKGDRIFLFARIFSPARFQDRIQLRWLRDEGKPGWVVQDVIPMEIRGGREEGYRGVAIKSNYGPGSWRVQVETAAGHELGRLYFTVIAEEGENLPDRAFQVDRS